LSHIQTAPTPHTTFTNNAIRQHELEQAFLHRNPTYVFALQQEHMTRLETALDTLDTRLPPHLHDKVVQGQIGLLPMEQVQIQTSTCYLSHQHQSGYGTPQSSVAAVSYTMPQQCHRQGKWILPQPSPAITSYTMSQQNPTSSIAYLPSSEDLHGYSYTQGQPQSSAYHSSHQGPYLQKMGQELAGVGAQFDSQEYPEYEEPLFFTKYGE
jgi:hypothetical protein